MSETPVVHEWNLKVLLKWQYTSLLLLGLPDLNAISLLAVEMHFMGKSLWTLELLGYDYYM